MAARQVVLSRKNNLVLLAIPLVLSAFTHLYNPSGFPDLFYDEGVYMRRAMHVLDGLGPQEGTFYDHPYFGQLFLAGLFKIISYPDSLNPSNSPQFVAALYSVPRILMGVLAVADTFLIYKISEKRYGTKVALIASILFAVMPITWMTRRILLDSILLPFFLGSILFAINSYNSAGRKKWIWLALSGTLLGIAIFTKLPTFTMIPLVAYVVYSGHREKRGKGKTLALWLIPVILIPMIWPMSSIATGHFNDWLKDVLWQTQRQSQGFGSIVASFFLYDPVLLILGAASFIYAGVKREVFILLWIGPFLAFLILIGYVQYFYWIPVLPVFCIAAGRLIERITLPKPAVSYAIIACLATFGLISTTLLITSNVTSAQFEAAAFVANNSDNETTIASNPTYSWLFIYVFNMKHSLNDYRDLLFHPVETKNLVLISDRHFQFNIDAGKQLREAYNSTKPIAIFKGEVLNYDLGRYPYTNIGANYEGSSIEIRARN